MNKSSCKTCGTPFGELVCQQCIHCISRDRDALQAQVDTLILEFCPDEMTHEQIQEWELNQRTSDTVIPDELWQPEVLPGWLWVAWSAVVIFSLVLAFWDVR